MLYVKYVKYVIKLYAKYVKYYTLLYVKSYKTYIKTCLSIFRMKWIAITSLFFNGL